MTTQPVTQPTTQVAHTPGPWGFTGGQMHDGNRVVRAGADAQGEWIALACDFNRYDRDEEADANARLIASAPELLAASKAALKALRQFVDEAGGCDHSVGICACSDIATADTLAAAIAKAESGAA